MEFQRARRVQMAGASAPPIPQGIGKLRDAPDGRSSAAFGGPVPTARVNATDVRPLQGKALRDCMTRACLTTPTTRQSCAAGSMPARP